MSPDHPVAEIAILVEEPAWERDVDDASETARRAAEAAVAHLARSAALEAAELTIVLADDDFVRDLNRRYRDKDAPTNVLSFPASDPPVLDGPLGDVVLAYETSRREAMEQGKPLAHHLSHLIVHGVLHLAGRDHEAENEAERMEDEERAILAGLGVPDPYAPAEEIGAARGTAP